MQCKIESIRRCRFSEVLPGQCQNLFVANPVNHGYRISVDLFGILECCLLPF